ncbi:hypothetical protein VE02_09460 [Pseudogymnoascus sp. 03VT05]|nr:hypothetical protein VE02_09460 [Pseudogymnoascus sp. 03VT05]
MVTVPSFDRINWSSEIERKPEIQSSSMGNYFEETRAMAEQPPRNMAINIALSEYCGIESTAYALAVIRPDGSVTTFVSDEVKTDPKFLFTPAFHNEFLVASGRAPSHPMLKHESDGEYDPRVARYAGRIDSSYRKRTPPRSHTSYDDDCSTDSSMSPGSRKRLRATATRSRERAIPTLPTRTISIGDDAARDDVYHYYPPRLPLRSTYVPTTPDTTTGDDYADAPYPIHHHNGLTHNPHPPQPPTYPTRAWPAQEINIYTGGSPWPTPPAVASGPMQHYPFGMSTATSSPPQQQGQGAVFLPPPMSQGYGDVNGARDSFDGGWEVI